MLIMNENEKRLLEVTIASEDDLPFTIHEARYELILHQCNGEDITEDSGTCDVDGNIVTCMVSPTGTGLYIVRLTMQIADETVVRKVHIQVG